MMGKVSFLISLLAVFCLGTAGDLLAAEPPLHESGGIGDDDPLLPIIGDYNLQLVFAAQGSGEYLADVKVLIAEAGGRAVLETTSPGPRFYVRLPSATYRIRVEYAGQPLQRSVTLAERRLQSVYFYWPRADGDAALKGETKMLDSLKEAGKTIGHEIGRAWELVSEGWRELFNRNGNALTEFSPGIDSPPPPPGGSAAYPRWSLLAGEVEESEQEIVVRVELPGLEKSDCQVTIAGNRLIVSGTKRVERVSEDSAFHVMERAYGAFQRIVPLPGNVLEEQADASYRNGVLTVRLPKRQATAPRSIPVS